MLHLTDVRSPLPTDQSVERRRTVATWIGILLVTVAASVAPTSTAHASVEPRAGGVIHVDPSGDDSSTGAPAEPVATIEHAVRLADDGDTVVIHPGHYHESVQVYDKQVDLIAAPGVAPGSVVLDGAVPIESFVADDDGRWWASWSTDFERSGAPFTTDERPEAGWPEQFFIDGAALVQVASLDDLTSGGFFYDSHSERVWFADDPSRSLIEGSDLAWGLYLNLADGSTVSGLTVERYATQTRNMAAVRAYADDLTLSDLIVRDNARIGLSVVGDHVTVEDVTSIRNGHLGIHAHHSHDLRILGATVVANNRERFDPLHSAGGIKVTESTDLEVSDSTVVANAGPGIWTDLDVVGAAIAGNTVTGNGRSGVEIELSSQVVVVDNVVEGNSEAGIWVLESSQVDVWHNRVLDNVRDIWIEDGPRDDVLGVAVVNNLLGGTTRLDGAGAIISVDDWTEERSAADMDITLGANRYWLVPGSVTSEISRWARWPEPLSYSGTIDEHRAVTGQDHDSDAVSSAADPFGIDTDAKLIAGRTMPASIRTAAEWTGPAAPAGPLPTEPDTTPVVTTTTTVATATTTATTTTSATTPPGAPMRPTVAGPVVVADPFIGPPVPTGHIDRSASADGATTLVTATRVRAPTTFRSR